MSGEVAVRAVSVGRRFGEVVALEGLSFEVRRGETFGLIGSDGAGKTTALRAVLGLVAPDSGRVETLGLDPVRQRRHLARRVGYLSQGPSLYGDLTVEENLAFFAAIHDVRGHRGRGQALLERFRLAPFRARRADQLSGGMRQKLALACTLVHRPELLVLDEPTTGIDPLSRRDFWNILTGLERQGLTILLATPYLDEAERCRRIALLDRGALLALGEPERLRAGVEGVVVEILATPRPRVTEVLRGQPGVARVESFGERLHATIEGVKYADETARRLRAELDAAGVQVESVRPVAASLEDFFIARLGGGAREPRGEEISR